MTNPLFPHIIKGKVTGTGSANAAIVLEDLNTGDTLTLETDINGKFLFDCANFENGYSNGDELIIRLGDLICERRCAAIDKTSLFQVHNMDKIKVI